MSRFITFALLGLIFAINAHARIGDRFYIPKNNTKIYSAPSVSAPVVMRLNKGDRVIEWRRQGSWVKIGLLGGRVGKDGWVQVSRLVWDSKGKRKIEIEKDQAGQFRLPAPDSGPGQGADRSEADRSENVRPRELATGGRACPGHPDRRFKVNVRIDIPPTRIHRSRSSAELTKATFHGRRSRILGLTAPDLKIETNGAYVTEPTDTGYCFWVEGIDVTLRYRSMDIYVASNYRRRSCNYRVILQHEEKHVRAARTNLERYAPRIRFALTSLLIPKGRSPVAVASPEDGEGEMQRLFAKLLKPVYADMHVALRTSQGELDTPQAYRRLFGLCKRW